jgi:renalase
MLPMLCEALGSDPETATHVSTQRWRRSEVTAPLRRPFVCDDNESLYLGGDWALGARVEAAWQSGSKIAADIFAHHGHKTF